MTEQQAIEKSLAFLQEIGIPVNYRSIDEECFLPGLLIENGSIVIDKEKWKYPGDILHEAGHIAVVPAEERKTLNAAAIAGRTDHAAEEMAAIAWSYAACLHLGIDPYFVFHKEGYHGGGESIADSFNQGQYFGVPILQWYGMTAEPHMTEKTGRNAYPDMAIWLRP